MAGRRFGDWLVNRLAELDWSPAEAAQKLGLHPSTLSRWQNGKAWPDRRTSRRVVDVLGIEKLELDAMIEADQARPLPSGPVDRNVEPINWDAMTPDQAAFLRRLLQGALDVHEARERGEA